MFYCNKRTNKRVSVQTFSIKAFIYSIKRGIKSGFNIFFKNLFIYLFFSKDLFIFVSIETIE